MQYFGGERQAAVCRELTKRFEEVSRGSLTNLLADYAGRDVKGEIVLLVDRSGAVVAEPETVGAALDKALESLSVKDAAAAVAEAFSLPRRDVYQMALSRGRNEKGKA